MVLTFNVKNNEIPYRIARSNANDIIKCIAKILRISKHEINIIKPLPIKNGLHCNYMISVHAWLSLDTINEQISKYKTRIKSDRNITILCNAINKSWNLKNKTTIIDIKLKYKPNDSQPKSIKIQITKPIEIEKNPTYNQVPALSPLSLVPTDTDTPVNRQTSNDFLYE